MASLTNNSEEFLGTVELQVPSPVIILAGMNLQNWKQYFVEKMRNTSNHNEKFLYTKCFKAMLWAEFCNATISYVGNSKDSDGNLTVKFIFYFPDNDCRFLFQLEWDEHSRIVAKE